MFPNERVSSSAVTAPYLAPDQYARLGQQLIDRELGGVALNDASQGLKVHVWIAQYDDEVNGIRLTNETTSSTSIVVPDVTPTEVSLAFDQNMRPAIAYVVDGVAYLQWYDSVVAGNVTSVFAGARNPMLCLDDKRVEMFNISDIVLAYIRQGSVYRRQQRDRFEVEYLVGPLPEGNSTLLGLGMNSANRVQVYVRVIR